MYIEEMQIYTPDSIQNKFKLEHVDTNVKLVLFAVHFLRSYLPAGMKAQKQMWLRDIGMLNIFRSDCTHVGS